MQNRRQLILASQSPRRRQLMAMAGYQFVTTSADIDETPLPTEAAADYTLRVSREKALAIQDQWPTDALIITADTTVALDGEILGKPADDAEARVILAKLRDRHHQVHTAVTVLDSQTGNVVQSLATTDIKMRPYTDSEIEAYIATGDPFDKAGSYAIQHQGFSPVEAVDGCYTNVIGLPLCHMARLLSAFEILPDPDHATLISLPEQALDCPTCSKMLDGNKNAPSI